jgi:lambda family phage portal protein
MGLKNSFGNLVDGTVGIFAPGAAYNRQISRNKLKYAAMTPSERSAMYAAAKTGRNTGGWAPADVSVNELIKASSGPVRARVRQLVRDFPVFSRAVDVVCDYVVGSGIVYQSRVEDAKGELDHKSILAMEDSFKWWADEADLAGKQHLYELMDLAKRQELESGEYIILKRSINDSKRYLPFGLQMVEADWLTSDSTRQVPKSNEIEQGIEYNKNTGQVKYYHFTDPDSWGKSIRIKAENVIHGFQVMRPGQFRGISPFAAGVMVAHDISEYMDSEIDAAKAASKYMALVTSPHLAARQTMLEDGTGDDEDKKIDELENAIIEYLAPGEEVTFATHNRPGANFPPTIRLMLSMVACTINVPYELISFDYTGMNYSTSRIIRNDFAHYLRPLAVRHIRQFCMPIFKPFLDTAVFSGKLKLPGYYENPMKFFKSEWQPPGMEPVDPLREGKAQVDQVNATLRSPQEIVKARGRDYEDVLKEIKRANELKKKYKLDSVNPSTSTANNPAAVEKQKALHLESNGVDVESIFNDIMDKFDEISQKL